MSDGDESITPTPASKVSTKALASAIKKVSKYNAQIERAHEIWDSERAEVERQLEFFKTYQGEEVSDNIILRKSERFIAVFAAGLIEDRPGQTSYAGGRQGFSIPVASIGGHAIRYNFGSSRGHIDRGAPVEAVVDAGKFVITTQRIVFVGSKQTRECEFSNLVSADQPFNNRTVISVSNRQKATILSYAPDEAQLIHSSILLATAIYQGTLPNLISSWERTLSELQGQEPKLAPVPTLADIENNSFVAPSVSSELQGDIEKGSISGIARVAFIISLAAELAAFIPVLGLVLCFGSLIFAIVAMLNRNSNRRLAAGAAAISFAAEIIAIIFTIAVVH